MSKLKVGTQNASKVYLGGNNILADLTGLNYNVDETLFRNNASGYCFINVSDEDKSIYIYDDSFSEAIVIPKNQLKFMMLRIVMEVHLLLLRLTQI